MFSSSAPLLSGAIVLATISCLCQFINSRDLVTTPQPGHMFCTGVTKLDHARCIYGEENYVLYNARINCRPTIKSTPTMLGVFRQALDHNQIKLNQSPVIFITKPGHLTVVRRTLLFWIIGIVTQAVSMRDVENEWQWSPQKNVPECVRKTNKKGSILLLHIYMRLINAYARPETTKKTNAIVHFQTTVRCSHGFGNGF